MSLTFSAGPLAAHPTRSTNFTIDGPRHRILFEPFGRRVRAVLAGEVVLDTVDGMLLHETGIAPVLYAPVADFAVDHLVDSDHSTHCPYKGDAAYRSVRVRDTVATDAVWYYPDPIASAPWLAGYAACYWDAFDEWFDEDERVEGHLRDPYHRVDVRRSSRRVVVTVAGEVVARSQRPMLVAETGLPNRFYIPRDEVRMDALTPSAAVTVCPYKGRAGWWSHAAEPDVAWSYEAPLDEAARLVGHVAFAPGDVVEVAVDGEPLRR